MFGSEKIKDLTERVKVLDESIYRAHEKIGELQKLLRYQPRFYNIFTMEITPASIDLGRGTIRELKFLKAETVVTEICAKKSK